MMKAILIVGTLFTAGTACAQNAPQLSDPKNFVPISCTDAMMHVSDADICGVWRGATGQDPTVQTARLLIIGSFNTLEYKATMSYSDSARIWMTVTHSSDIPDHLKSYDEVTESASSWLGMVKSGSDFMQPFAQGARQCFAFHRRGPAWGSGTKYRTTGWFCDASKTSGYTAEEARAVLAMIQTSD